MTKRNGPAMITGVGDITSPVPATVCPALIAIEK
jgi:hypothetical protein